jgi:DNA-binding ferritin-like protein
MDKLTQKVLEQLKKRGLYEQNIEDLDTDDEDLDDNFDDESSDDEESNDEDQKDEFQSVNDGTEEQFCEMVCKLLHSQTQVHVFHLGVTGSGSYAAHKALQGYYEGIDGLVDGLIESYQGKYGLLKSYKSFKIQGFKSIKSTIQYLESLNEMIEENRDCCDDSFIQNQIDTVQELLFSTLYKLKYLS